ncbi:MAG: S8 family serine peptidase, partial [Gracilimonas sp.]
NSKGFLPSFFSFYRTLLKQNKAALISKEMPELVPGRYIVVFKDQGEGQISEQAARQAVLKTNAIFTDFSIKQDSLIHQYKYAAKGFAAKLTDSQAEQLRKDSRIKTVVQDVKYAALGSVNPANISYRAKRTQTIDWGVARVGGPLDGTGKRAWVLDTGIYLIHNDLNVDEANSVSFIATESANDLNGHGTHVAGIIGAKNNNVGTVGVAANAEVVSVKVCDKNGTCYVSDVKAGVDYAANNYTNGEVANISIRYPTNISSLPQIDIALSILEDAIKAAADDGLLFTLIAGNEKDDVNDYSPSRLAYPRVFVTSSIHDDDDFSVSFSCNPNQGSNYGSSISYAAPGDDILSLWSGGGTAVTCGTSQAAPHLAGLLLMNGINLATGGYATNDPDNNPDPIAVDGVLAPVIMASIDNNSPKLSWSSVLGAVEYEVYRSFETGSWSKIATVSTTSHTDGTVMNQNLQVISSPPYTMDDFYSYKVRAVPSNGPKSNFSIVKYFSVGECTGPGCSS